MLDKQPIHCMDVADDVHSGAIVQPDRFDL
jgi:hypothetical protein